MEQDNVKIVQEIYQNFGQGNIPAILARLADDVEWREPAGGTPPLAGTYRGHAGVGGFFAKMNEVAAVEQFEPRELIAQGEVVVALGHYRFRSRATGRVWGTDWAMVWRFQDGKVKRFQIHKDSAAETAALRAS